MTAAVDRHALLVASRTDGARHAVLIDAEVACPDTLVGALARRDVVLHVVPDLIRALARIAVTDVDVVMISVASHVPDLPEVVELLRYDLGLPVLLAHGEDDVEQIAPAVLAGALPTVYLPYDATAIATTVERISPHRPPPAPLVVGSLQLDRLAFTAHLGNDELDLSVREFNILHALADRCDEVVTRESLRRFVVDRGHRQPTDPDRSVWAAVQRLRHKLEVAGAHDPVRTLRAVGYVLRSHALSAPDAA